MRNSRAGAWGEATTWAAACILLSCAFVACESDETAVASATSGAGAANAGGASSSAAQGGSAAASGGGQATGGGMSSSSGGGGPVGTGTCRYPGIPHPTDALPDGIMPTLPTPGARAGFPYDPCTIETPALADGADVWVVATDGDDGSAGNNGQGTVAAPRRTIPFGTFDAGTIVYVIGNNSPYGTVDYDIGQNDTATFNCTEGAPCWIVGIDQPRIARRFEVQNSTHLLIDGLSMVDGSGNRPWGSINFTDSSFITLRNTEIRGNGENSSGGNAISISGVEMFVSYRLTIRDIGSWESNATGLDVHGWRPAYRNRHLWLMDSELYHLQADGIQVGNSNNPNPQADSSHYVFIGGNTFYENYENALDNKNGYHVVFSTNEVHDFYAASDAGGANGTAIILSNNAEGPWTSYHWAINNHIHDTALAIRDSGSETDEKNYAVGNIIHDADTAFIQANNDDGRESWFVHNSVTGSTTAVDAFQGGTNASLFVRGNVFHQAGDMDCNNATDSFLEHNVLFGVNDTGNWDSKMGNLTSDPLLVAPQSGNLALGSGSPAIDAMPAEDGVFALFQTLYGLDIRVDRNGTARPSGSGWDMGALEAR